MGGMTTEDETPIFWALQVQRMFDQADEIVRTGA